MKKLVAFLLATVMTFAMSAAVFAWGPASGPANNNPGANRVDVSDLAVRIGGNGNSARLTVYANGDAIYVSGRPANNVYNVIALPGKFEGYVLGVFVRGNSILRVTVLEVPECNEPYVVNTEVERRFVRYDQIESYFAGTSEVADSRTLTDSKAVAVNVVRCNEIPGVNGMAVKAGARVTGTLNYRFVRNYIEQWERVVQYVTITTWSDGTVVEDAAPEFVDGVVRKAPYTTGPFNGSRAVDITYDQIVLHMGHGQSDAHGRFMIIEDEFTVALELHNTGSTPRITVTIVSSNLEAL